MRATLSVWVFVLLAGRAVAQPTSVPPAEVRFDSEQAEAVLAIVGGRPDWDRLASAEGYIRLKKREAEVGRPFSDDDFKRYLASDDLRDRKTKLIAALDECKRADFNAIGQRVRSYLPGEAKLRATVYIVLKPRNNSFVYELKTNPAVFLYLDPAVTKDEFENTVAHELHHVGLASLPAGNPAHGTSLSAGQKSARRYLDAFGEGLAMLAAAGGPDVHPHLQSPPEVRARWDRDVLNLARDLRSLEAFFLETVAGKLNENQQREKAMSFFGIQGPWYTVGWTMAATVEKAKGRAALIECMKDLPKLLLYYNEAVDESKPKWSNELLEALSIR